MTETSRQESIQPASFRPPGGDAGNQRRPPSPLWIGAAALLLILMGGLWFVMTATSIKVQTEPVSDQLDIRGGLAFEIGGSYLLRPGTYEVQAEKAGYHLLRETIQVEPDGQSLFRFALEKLPGRLAVSSKPVGALLVLDEQRRGATPVSALELEAGEYGYQLSAPRYQTAQGKVNIEGMGREQRLHLELEPAWADVTVRSDPPGATLSVDGEPVGETGEEGFTAQIMPGKHTLSLSLPGYEAWAYSIITEANQPQQLPLVRLQKLYASVQVSSRPSGARVSLNGEYQGIAPMVLELRPDSPAEVAVSKAGYKTERRELALASGERRELELKLTPLVGEIAVRATPADALLYIDGILRGRANQTVALTATEHTLTVKKDGYASHTQRVTPRQGMQQVVNVRLLTERQAFLVKFPKTLETSTGDKLVIIEPGSFSMGSPRRAQGRQSNEVQRDIKLTRLYYLATREVTNKAFRQFRQSHSSGIVQRTTLDNDNYPVARVSWRDAVEFCNWLSRRDGLPEAYKNGRLVKPLNTGYRLPTEAEWVWAARFAGGLEEREYAWGNSMPPSGAAGNYADISAQGVVDKTLGEYNDNYVAAAPVGRFSANALGLYDLGGNVSEWMHDVYGVDISTSLEVDPIGNGDGELHTIRGSSWRHGRITELRLVYRDSGAEGRDDVGFRIARYAQSEK